MKTKLSSLNKIPLIYLYYSFILAFSDYQVEIKLTYEGFKKLLKVRDIRLNISFGIFLDDIIELETIKYFNDQLSNLLDNINNEVKNSVKKNSSSYLKKNTTDKKINLTTEEIKKIPISFVLLGERKNVSILLEAENKILNFKKAVYDSGTGTVPKFRSMGFSKLIINEIKSKLKKHRVDGFVLEVLEENEKAKNLYLNAGFNISRKFHCYNIEKEKLEENLNLLLAQNKESYESIINKVSIKKMKSLLFFKESNIVRYCNTPLSWQNSIKSIRNILNKISILSIYYKNKLIALSAIEKTNGDIKFIGVDKNYQTIFENNFTFILILLKAILKETKSKRISLLNIDKKSSIYEYLKIIGFNNFINQFEMYIKI